MTFYEVSEIKIGKVYIIYHRFTVSTLWCNRELVLRTILAASLSSLRDLTGPLCVEIKPGFNLASSTITGYNIPSSDISKIDWDLYIYKLQGVLQIYIEFSYCWFVIGFHLGYTCTQFVQQYIHNAVCLCSLGLIY